MYSFFSLLNKCQQVKYEGNDELYYVLNKDIDRLLKFNEFLSLSNKISLNFNKDTDIYFCHLV